MKAKEIVGYRCTMCPCKCVKEIKSLKNIGGFKQFYCQVEDEYIPTYEVILKPIYKRNKDGK